MTRATHLTGTTMATNSGALTTADAAETVYDTTIIVSFMIGGKTYQKAAVTDGATPTSDSVSGATFASQSLADDTGSVFVWCLNASGTVSVHQGSVEDITPTTSEFVIAPAFPDIDLDTYCPFAYTVLKNESGSAFIFGTTNWNTAGITHTDVNIGMLPSRPQES
jgi:hypothetical protein